MMAHRYAQYTAKITTGGTDLFICWSLVFLWMKLLFWIVYYIHSQGNYIILHGITPSSRIVSKRNSGGEVCESAAIKATLVFLGLGQEWWPDGNNLLDPSSCLARLGQRPTRVCHGKSACSSVQQPDGLPCSGPLDIPFVCCIIYSLGVAPLCVCKGVILPSFTKLYIYINGKWLVGVDKLGVEYSRSWTFNIHVEIRFWEIGNKCSSSKLKFRYWEFYLFLCIILSELLWRYCTV